MVGCHVQGDNHGYLSCSGGYPWLFVMFRVITMVIYHVQGDNHGCLPCSG